MPVDVEGMKRRRSSNAVRWYALDNVASRNVLFEGIDMSLIAGLANV